jgi:ribonuclease J
VAVPRRGPGPVPGADEVLFLPLGGCSEIGMNMSLYGHAGKWLIVDAGVAFAGEDMPGIQALMPDPSFIEERRADLVGLVVTHAHEDHIGAIHHLWPRLRCPIYATPFAAHVLRERFVEAGTARDVRIRIIPVGASFRAGPFAIDTIAVTHSIPEPVALAIRTAAGTVLHTGDFKFDPEPLVGFTTDFARFEQLGRDGVLAMMGDSTNALVDGVTGSEADARAGLEQAFAGRRGAVAVTCFASNVARLKAIAEAARMHDRQVVLAGRSLMRMEQAARACGHLDGVPAFLNPTDAARTPRRHLVLACTGSQGEERAALSRIARGEHRHLDLRTGDTAIFSARAIPGNEEAITGVQFLLRAREVEVVTAADARVHVSGHPSRGDLTRLYDLIRPAIAVPVHGTPVHLQAHADLALACGVGQVALPEDGLMLRLSRAGVESAGRIDPKRLAHDGAELLAWPAEQEAA